MRPSISEREKRPANDYGFSSQVGSRGSRLILRDGSFNVVRTGLPFFRSFSIYHSLINMSWTGFYSLILAAFILGNALFSGIYLAVGISHLEGAAAANAWERFSNAFFFSAQTITTVGYGHIHPSGFLTSTLAALESMLGLLAFAIATGLLFARFARPQAKILFSGEALVAPYHDHSGFMFRIANARNHTLIEAEVQVGLSLVTGQGASARRHFHELGLERSRINFFAMSWTVVHPIDERSPLRNLTPEDLRAGDAEFFVLVKAYDDSFNQTVHARFSYKPEEIVWGAKFSPIFGRNEAGAAVVDLGRLGEYEKAALPAPASLKD